MTYPKTVIQYGILPPNVNYYFTYPYLDASSLDDHHCFRRVGVAGLLDQGDTVVDETLIIEHDGSERRLRG